MNKKEDNKVVNMSMEKKMLPTPIPSLHQLTTEEVLKFKNLRLQKQLANKELESVSLQEELIAKLVSTRVGEDVSRWHYDLQQGVVIKPTASQPPQPVAPQSVLEQKEDLGKLNDI